VAISNLVPRVLRLLGQRVVAGRDYGVMDVVVELLPNIPAVNFFPLGTHPRVSSGDNPLTKNPKDSGCEIVLQATQSTQVPDL